jgi:hypothetical protein
VAGETEAARVGVAVAVAEQRVGPAAQLAQRRGRLAERQQAGNVGKAQRAQHGLLLDDRALPHVPQHSTGDAGAPVAGEGDGDPGDASQRPARALEAHPAGELALDLDRPCGRHVPAVRSAEAATAARAG